MRKFFHLSKALRGVFNFLQKTFLSFCHREVVDVENRKLIKYYCKDIDIDNLLMKRRKTLAGYCRSLVFITNANDSGNFLCAELSRGKNSEFMAVD